MQCIKKSENINLLWASVIIEELVRNEITYFCISPGSRSTPLTVAAARHPKIESKIIYDERGAAFHALGFARASQKPAVLICTSGTAVANYYPAVIEAYQENIPVIILSADRPPELRGRGANQTIDQIDIFGKYCRYFVDMPCPSLEEKADFVLKKTSQLVRKSVFPQAGPVHMNCMFREPLAPSAQPWPEEYLADLSPWLTSANTFLPLPKQQNLQVKSGAVIKLINDNKTGIILAGRMSRAADQKAVLALADKTGWPVFADITSGLRLNGHSDNVIHFFDQLLLSSKIKKSLLKQPILHFGGQFVSKRLLKFLEEHNGIHIHILETEKVIDPAHNVTTRFHSPIADFIELLLPATERKQRTANLLYDYNQKVKTCIREFLSNENKINEISAAVIISKYVFNDSALFVSSSMPVRDMDMFAVPGNNHVTVGANRGASGIDGTIATAVGFANGLQQPLTLVIGDLAMLHDLSSFTIIKECSQPFLIVLINNQGGGIFSFLPIAKYEDVFEKNFATPHGYTFEKIADMFGLKYFSPRTKDDFSELYSQYQYSNKAMLIEIKTNRQENAELHKRLQQKIMASLP